MVTSYGSNFMIVGGPFLTIVNLILVAFHTFLAPFHTIWSWSINGRVMFKEKYMKSILKRLFILKIDEIIGFFTHIQISPCSHRFGGKYLVLWYFLQQGLINHTNRLPKNPLSILYNRRGGKYRLKTMITCSGLQHWSLLLIYFSLLLIITFGFFFNPPLSPTWYGHFSMHCTFINIQLGVCRSIKSVF